MSTPDAAVARRMWILYEPVHALTYFAPEALSAFEDLGLRGFWRGYFAGRSAPLGPVGPAPVVASFFGFAPAMVARALPSVWELVTPRQALQARAAGACAALDRSLPGHDLTEAAGLLESATEGLEVAGRILGAVNAALPRPDRPAERLWQAATVLREHRGDGHVAALVAAGLSGCETLVLRSSLDLTRDELQPYRGWTDEQWGRARERLTGLGWIGPDGTATPTGIREFQAIEDATDRAAALPWAALGAERTERLAALLAPITGACSTALRFPNPIGLPPATAEPRP